MLPFLNDHLHTKNLGFYLIPFRDINDQSILQFDCTRRKPDYLTEKKYINCVVCKIFTKEHTKIYLEDRSFHRKIIKKKTFLVNKNVCLLYIQQTN